MEVINFEKATKNVRCWYCQIDENSQCHVDGFEDPEGDVRLTICVGGGEMILELTRRRCSFLSLLRQKDKLRRLYYA